MTQSPERADTSRSIRIAQVVAVARNGVIGRDGGLPWRVPSDLKTFKRLTMGKPIIMGRKTFDSIGKPLPGRTSIVVTRDPTWRREGVHVVPTVEDAIEMARTLAHAAGCDEIMVIGGAQIYTATRAVADRVYLTRIDAEPAGDAWFDDLEPSKWSRSSAERLHPAPNDEFAAVLEIYDRIA